MVLRFADVIGQPGAVRLLRRLVERQRVPHAVLLDGLPGCGRRTLARALAAALLCAAPHAGDACGSCASCTALAHGTHPDFAALPNDSDAIPAELAALSSVDATRTIPVEWVREVIAECAWQTSMLGRGRVFLIPAIERFAGNPAAANSLLKILEEPPGACRFVMTSASLAAVLPTIRSRAQAVRLRPLDAEAVEAVLIRGGLPASLARVRAALTDGGHRGLWNDEPAPPVEAIAILAQEGFDLNAIATVAEALPTEASAEAEAAGRTLLAEQRQALRRWLLATTVHLRPQLTGPHNMRTAAAIARVLDAEALLRRNIAPRLVLESLGLG